MSDDVSSRQTKTVTIAAGTSVSDSVDLGEELFNGFIMPSAWTAASISIEVSQDNTNWISAIYDSTNTQVGSYTNAVAGAAYAVDVLTFSLFRYVRFRSGTNSSPVVQAATRTLICCY